MTETYRQNHHILAQLRTVSVILDCRRPHLLDRLLDVRVLLEELLVQRGPGESSRARGGAGVRVVGGLGLKRDGLALQHPWVSSRWPCHHVASNLLLLWGRSALQYHRGGVVVVVVVYGGKMAVVRS